MTSTTAPVATPTKATTDIAMLAINTVRTLSMDAVQKADSGHPGTPMALAPLAYVLWTRHMRYDPRDPAWPDRDRFVLSAGHASMLLYSALFLTGYDLSLDDLKQFRQWGSKTPGHPEHGETAGVETTTGPLGQGIGNAIGMAAAEAHLAAVFNKAGPSIVDHYTWFICGDGDLMEGVSHEAASFAGHAKLGKLIGFYDDNKITIDGPTDLTYSDDAGKRFEAYGWHVQHVADVNDLAALDHAIAAAKAATDRPSLIIVRSHIGYGSPKQDTNKAHGEALGVQNVSLTKTKLGWPSQEAFFVPDESLAHWRQAGARGRADHDAWATRLADYRAAHPDLAAEFDRRIRGDAPSGWESAIPTFTPETGAVASRAAAGKVLNAIAPKFPELFGGSADLNPSTLTTLDGAGTFTPDDRAGQNIHYGIREHGMGSIMNGMALHGGVLPYGATFLIFSDYMRPAIRLAALMHQHVIYVFTHDSIGLGEDGPTHQPIEQLSTLRAIPNMTVIRPADASETAEAWRTALAHRDGPVALVLSRQKLVFIDRAKFGTAAGVARGGYVLGDTPGGPPQVVLIASGSEVGLILEAQQKLAAKGVRARTVSMPSTNLFARQPQEYRDQVLPPTIRRVAVEAGSPMSWYEWVGSDGAVIGLDRFGASAPAPRLFQELGITVDHILAVVGQPS
jgi:transketolase